MEYHINNGTTGSGRGTGIIVLKLIKE